MNHLRQVLAALAWSVVLAIVVAALFPYPARAAFVSCSGTQLYYNETGDGPDLATTEKCSTWGYCKNPDVAGPFYSLDNPACNPYFATCAMTAELDLEVPGNHQNHPSDVGYYYSYVAEELYHQGGSSPIAECGVPGAAITEDFGIVYVTASANCFNPSGGAYLLKTIVCKNGYTSCPKEVDTPLDFAGNAGCVIPQMEKCGTGDQTCRDCTAAGTPPDGSGPGYGGPGDLATGGARLRYAAGGAGIAGFPHSDELLVTLGKFWSADYRERILPVPDESHVFLVTRYGTYREFKTLDTSTGIYGTAKPSSEKRTLTWTGSGWTLTDLDGTVDAFDASGLWESTTPPEGSAYATVGHYTSGVLTSVTFPDGRSEEYTYYPSGDPAEGKLETTTEYGIDGTTHLAPWTYTWVGDDLVEIDRPDDTALLFAYDPTTEYLAKVTLRGKDGSSTRVVRAWSYDTDGKIEKVWKGGDTPAAGTEVWSFTYDSSTQTTVQPPVGDPITYTYDREPASQNVRMKQINGDCPVCDMGPNSQLSYDESSDNPLLPIEILDGRGTATDFEYNTSGLTTSRTEAAGDMDHQRLTTWAYDGPYPALVTEVDQPSVSAVTSFRTTASGYDSAGNPTSRTISGAESGSAFSYQTVITYNAAGQPLSIDPPGYTTTDQTTFTYDPSRGTGDLVLLTRTDPLVGTTTFGYDEYNRRTSVTDPNGLETTTAYDDLDRVTAVVQLGPDSMSSSDDLATAYEYTSFGDLLRTTLPGGNVIEYGYEPDTGRLISVERRPDATTHGERVVYTLDAAGNRTREERQRWDADSSAWVTHSATAYDYTNRCQVHAVRQGADSPEEATTTFGYDCNGNLEQIWEPNLDPETDPATTSYAYDPLNRLTSVTQAWEPPGGSPGTAVTTYSYDVQDHLTGVTDAEGNPTTYVYSDRDLLTREDSLVSGTTTHSYNEHGEEDQTTDARGVTVARTIDELDRVTNVDYPDDTLDTDYAYDAAPGSCGGTSSPVGRLASITRGGETLDYCYDHFGRTVKDGELGYSWDANGNRTGIVYPGGVSAAYGFDYADRETSLSVTTPAGGVTPTAVVTAASYLPSGPLSSLGLGNGAAETRAFDGRYVPTGITLSGLTTGVPGHTWTYTTDPVGNVTEIVETAECSGGGSGLVLENHTATGQETYTSCADLQAGNGFAVESPGHVTFQAQGKVVLSSGFSVGNGASFAAGAGSLPTYSDRTFGYQAPQYSLTSADGPWGTLDWTYDKIGNRLSESRDGGATADGYVYATNAASGDTPILDLVNLAVTGTRDYTWDAAGNLDSVAPGGNFVDFTFDDASRLAAADHPASGASAAFLYDGRGFLRSATETAGGTASVTPVYDSAGLLHTLRRKPSPTDPLDTTYVFYLAGRPVAQLEIDGTGAETWTYLTTDHLGTPLVATDQTGAITWGGGFRPFGTDYQAGTGNGASENRIDLRLPGQWVSDVWADATSGAGIYQNAWRWLETQTARYTRPDPKRLRSGESNLYLYARNNPLLSTDPLGLYTVIGPGAHRIREAFDLLRPLVLPGNKQSDPCDPCQKIFRKLGLDPRMLDENGAAPIIYTAAAPLDPSQAYGTYKCSDWIWIDRRLTEGSDPKKLRCLAAKLAHELAHFLAGHCLTEGPEGQGAEKACFGRLVEGTSECGF